MESTTVLIQSPVCVVKIFIKLGGVCVGGGGGMEDLLCSGSSVNITPQYVSIGMHVCLNYSAHSDGIWGVSWARNINTGNDVIVTGSVDSVVKAWIW